MPRSAPSARIASGSLIQIAWFCSMGRGLSIRSGVRKAPDSTYPAIRGPAHPPRGSWRRSCRILYQDRHLLENSSAFMDLNTVTEVAHPRSRAELPVWTAGDAWLAGGTWLFSEPQAHLSRLIDLTDLKWPALTVTATGLQIAATCA